jgi:hypothetical protein
VPWVMLALFALEALRYLLLRVPFPMEMESFEQRDMCRTSSTWHFTSSAIQRSRAGLKFGAPTALGESQFIQ